MSNAARLGDRSLVPKNEGGCACVYGAAGPATSGSSNVLINNRPAVRVDDRGMHQCGGVGTWKAKYGAPRVLVNGKNAHRRRDVDKHENGFGETVQGSSDVLIGDYICEEKPRKVTFKLRLMDMPGPMGAPLIEAPWRLYLLGREIESGLTDKLGRVNFKSTLSSATRYCFRYPGRTIEIIAGDTAPIDTVKGVQIRLAFLGYNVGHVTGQTGLRVTNAVREFQLDHGLPPDGDCDNKTRSMLKKQATF